ncbi:hypothetical protein [Algoriphagus namhaensis]
MRKSLFLIFFALISHANHAQFFIAGSHLNGSTSIADLRQEAGGLFFPSLSAFMLYEFAANPIQIGLDFGYGIYGSKLERRTDLFPGFTDEFRLRRNNNIVTGMLTMRYLPFVNSKLTPFLEAQFGGNYLYTRYKIRASIDEEAFEAGTDHSEWTLAYRMGAGIQIPMAFWDDHMKLEIKTTYQSSNDIRFLTRGDVTYLPDEGIFEYNYQRGPLQFLTFSVGFVVYDIFY